MNTRDKIAIITGASRGLGHATAMLLAEQSYRVVAVARNAPDLQRTVSHIRDKHGDALAYQADVRNRANVSALFEFVDRKLGPLELLINCAGVGVFGPIDSLSSVELDLVLDTNLKGTIYCCQEAVTRMKQVGRGHIVNVASSAGHVGRPNEAAYAASKFGVTGFTESLAAEVLKYGIIATLFSPGGMRTSFWENSSASSTLKTDTFMEPARVAKALVDTVLDSEGIAIQLVRIARLPGG